MKKKCMVLLLLVCCLTACSGRQATNKDTQKLAEQERGTVGPVAAAEIDREHIVDAEANIWTYTREELKEKAKLIVKGQVLDELTNENSIVSRAEEGDFADSFYSVRRVKLLEIYRNDTDQKLSEGEELSIRQSAAVYPVHGEYYLHVYSGDEVLEKGSSYLFYLEASGSEKGAWEILPAEDGLEADSEIHNTDW